jgi:hypothetical protein
MITKQKCLWYFVGDQAFKSLEEAQKADLESLLPTQWEDGTSVPRDGIAEWMLKNCTAICDTLQTTPRSRLKARKLHGATRKPRTPKVAPVTA